MGLNEVKTAPSLFYFCLYTTSATLANSSASPAAHSPSEPVHVTTTNLNSTNNLSSEHQITTQSSGLSPQSQLPSTATQSTTTAPPTRSDRRVYDEDNENHVLYFYPATFSSNDRLKQVGLAQALVNFSRLNCMRRTFDPKVNVDNVHSEKHRMVFYECESDIWILLNVNLGFIVKTLNNKKQRVEFLDDSVDDFVLQEIVKRSYHFFSLLYGRIDSLPADTRAYHFQSFFPTYLETVDWSRYHSWSQKSYFDLLSTIHLMKRNSGITISGVVVMNGRHLVWTDYSYESTRWLIKYLHHYSAFQSLFMKKEDKSKCQENGFVTIPRTVASNDKVMDPIIVFLDSTPHILLLYQVNDIIMALLIPNTMQSRNLLNLIQTYNHIDELIMTPLLNIAQEITLNSDENGNKKFLCFDRATFALKTLGENFERGLHLASDLSSTLNEIRREMERGTTEVFVKNSLDYWVGGTKSILNQEIFLLCTKKDATLAEIEEEMKRFKYLNLQTVFME